MGYQFKLPDIGEGVHEGEIVAWLVAEGDNVAEDQPLLEVMTDKVTAEIPSPVSGRVAQLHGKVGEVIAVGSVVVSFDATDAEPAQVIDTHSDVVEPVKGAAVEAPSPQTHTTMGVVLATPATRKLARTLGVDIATLTGTGDNGRVTVADVEAAAHKTKVTPSNGQPSKPTSQTEPAENQSPAQLSSQLRELPQKEGNPFSQPAVSKPVPQPVAGHNPSSQNTRPFVGVRRKIAQHLTSAKQTAPHFGYVDEVDMTAIVELRKQLKPQAEQDDVKLHYLPFMMMAVCRALKAHPILNSSLDEANGQIVLHDAINLGFAVAAEQGLVVPVIHQADTLSLKQLAQRIDTLATKARAGMLGRDEVQGGTFTLTSIGSIGGLFGLPIINVPEVAILGINKISRRPVVVTENGEEHITIRDMMYLSISCDHRVVDGADAAQFINTLIKQLQTPALWLYS